MEISHVYKRNGEKVPFDKEKIKAAIFKAMRACEIERSTAETLSERMTLFVVESLEKWISSEEKPGWDKIPSVEEIQDFVERTLHQKASFEVTKAYVLYREKHADLRGLSDSMNARLINEYVSKADWRVNENSNMGYSLQGLNNLLGGQISERYWLSQVYAKEVRTAHEDGHLHIHDLSLIAPYCVGWDLYDLLERGFGGVACKLTSAPPKHFASALGQIVNFMYTLQGEAAGAQALSNIDTLLAPFIRKDGLSYDEVKQHVQVFIFNLNVPTRVGGQTPFINFSFDLEPSVIYRDAPVMIGGVIDESSTYGEYQYEMSMFNHAFAEIMAAGDASGRVFSFPIPTYNITKNFDWDNPSHDPIWKMTGKYGIPYFSNFVGSDMKPEDARSMCCRLRLDVSELGKRGGGLFGSNPLTGSIGVVTINLPRLAYESTNEAEFLNLLDRQLELAAQSLTVKRELIESFTRKGLYPYTVNYLNRVFANTGNYWTNHFSTIGIIGMNEACYEIHGCDIGSVEGRNFALQTMDFLRNKLKEFQEKTGTLFNLEATPAEGASYRLLLCDQKHHDAANKYAFYSNSSQLPVGYTDDMMEAMTLQDELQCKYTGGTVHHVFIGSAIDDPNVVKELLRKITNTFKMPYFSLTPTFSVCCDHGYIPGEEHTCPECSNETEVYSRVVGFLRPVKQWNPGKMAEFDARKLYTKL